VESWH